MSAKHAPCPFCAGPKSFAADFTMPEADGWSKQKFYFRYCQTCNAQGPHGTTRASARDAWNDRSQS